LLLIAYSVPLYSSSALSLLFSGKMPLDFNLKFRDKPLLGASKTIKGTFGGIIGGFLVGVLLSLIFPFVVSGIENYYSLAFFLALGGVLGDLGKSFIKRRIGIKSGASWFPADQIDFILGGFFLSMLIRPLELELFIFLLICTIVVHPLINKLAFLCKLKKVPW
jgi:CDP-2,3-bis-(O-geranylgeranyl)-sn-glycerol synthase